MTGPSGQDAARGAAYTRCMHRLLRIALLAPLWSCSAGHPDGVEPVTGFELDRYLGTWYEIARLDHRFERGLSDVSAEYRRRDDGGVDVVNSGFNAGKREWQEARGKGYFVGPTNVGHLKVSFFGPFYGTYNVFELDDDYRYAMVSGADRGYLWILARDPQLDRATLEALVARAQELGFPTDELIFVTHDRHGAARNQ